MSRILVTGLGVVSAAGRGVAAAREAVVACRSGLGRLSRYGSARCGHFPVAEVRDVETRPGEPRTVTLGRIALEEALDSAALGAAPAGCMPRSRMGLVAGTCVAGMPETEHAIRQLLADGQYDRSVWLRHPCSYTTHALARDAGVGGLAMTVSNACSAGSQAIAAGADLLRAGEVDAVVAGGTDALCLLTLNGFASLLAMDPEGCRPFDRGRKGMSLGEGAAFLVLEREESVRERGVRPFAVFAGSANTCDAYHPTAPDPEGKGAEEAIRSALGAAGLDLGDVEYINAHGTGTPENDRTEGQALARLFGARVPPVSSSKRVFGHTLAAAGAVEAVVSVLAIRDGFLPGSCGLADLDPECRIAPIAETVWTRPRVVLSNSFGFGGNNTVLCFTAPEVCL